MPLTAYANRVLADGPAAFWRLDETSGTVMADSSGNGHHGTYSGATLGQAALYAGGPSAASAITASTTLAG